MASGINSNVIFWVTFAIHTFGFLVGSAAYQVVVGRLLVGPLLLAPIYGCAMGLLFWSCANR